MVLMFVEVVLGSGIAAMEGSGVVAEGMSVLMIAGHGQARIGKIADMARVVGMGTRPG